jgi:AraC-like DNA-binding protein
MDKAGTTFDHRDYAAPTYSLSYVLRGRGTYLDERGRSWVLEVGSFFQRLPGVCHSTRLDQGSRWLEVFVDLGPMLYAALAGIQVIRPEPRCFPTDGRHNLGDRMLAFTEELEQASEPDLARLCPQAIRLVVDAQRLAEPPSDDLIERACRALAEGATERGSLRDFCRQQRLDYDAFRRIFQKRLGISPGQYRIRRRLDLACQMLQQTDRSIVEIATELGYTSPYEFSAQFRRRMGVAPSRYRIARAEDP